MHMYGLLSSKNQITMDCPNDLVTLTACSSSGVKQSHQPCCCSIHLLACCFLYSTLQRELSAQSGRVQQLEAYLGGELPSEESGVTWREERDILTTRIRVGGCRDCMYGRKTSKVHGQRCSHIYRSLAKKGPVSNIHPPPYFALISCKGLKFTLKAPTLLTLRGEDFP